MERDAREEAQQALREEMQQVLSQSRQNVVALVTKRFPRLTKVAAKQVQKATNLNSLQQALISIATTDDAIEVANILSNLDEE